MNPTLILLVASVVELSLQSRADGEPLATIAFGTERVSARVAAFEAHGFGINELDFEFWQHAGQEQGARAVLLGASVLDVGSLLSGERDELTVALPVFGPAGLVVGTARVLVSRRMGRVGDASQL